MVKASEIRKKVRQAEAEKIKMRADVAVNVAQVHARLTDAQATLASAEAEWRKTVRAATNTHGYTLAELSAVTDISAATIRSAQPDTKAGTRSPDAPAEPQAFPAATSV